MCRRVVLYAVDERLRVFDAHAHGVGFSLQAHGGGVEHLVDVAGGVARSDDDRIGRKIGSIDLDTRNVSVAKAHCRNAPLEVDFATRIDNVVANVGDDARQAVGADMGVGLVEDFGRGAVEDEALEGAVVVAAFLTACEEFTVGECACAALAEGVVGVGVDALVALYEGDVLATLDNLLATLENNGFDALLNQSQGGKQSRRACADDDNFAPARDRRVVEMERSGLRLAVDEGFERQQHLQRPAAGIDRAFDDAQ